MSKVWTSEELARECKNCELASAGRIRSQAETIRKLRAKIAQLNRDSICRERVIRGLKHAVRMVCQKRDDQARAMTQYEYATKWADGKIDGISPYKDEVTDSISFVKAISSDADDQTVCKLVRRSVGEWEEVRDAD